MIAISFVGTGNYQPAMYTWQDHTCETHLMPEALQHLFDVSRTIAVVTEQSRQAYGSELVQLPNTELVTIPEGQSEEQLWAMFDILTESLQQYSSNEKLLIDITHGFRHLPLLFLAQAVYMQSAHTTEVERIVYGAYEAGDKGKRSPVLDLTPFLHLMNWSQATERFLQRGDAGPLRDILQSVHSHTHITNADYKAQRLQTLGSKLDQLHSALSLNRLPNINRLGRENLQLIDQVDEDLEKIARARPFRLLLGQLRNRLEQFVVEPEPDESDQNELFSDRGLNMQLRMLRFYIDTEQYAQAATLATELIISRYCLWEGYDPMSKDSRKMAANDMSTISHQIRDGIDMEEVDKKLAGLYDKCSGYRNDINHCGLREKVSHQNSLIRGLEKAIPEVEALVRAESADKWMEQST